MLTTATTINAAGTVTHLLPLRRRTEGRKWPTPCLQTTCVGGGSATWEKVHYDLELGVCKHFLFFQQMKLTQLSDSADVGCTLYRC